nr:lysylphosphatidylglycerol synthase transmembrane domain-containing protein [uncultured Dysosmobacter sp.]
MNKKQWKSVLVGIATLVLLSLLIFWVFRDHYREITRNIRAVRPGDLPLLLGMGVLYQIFESAVCYVLVKGQLSSFSFWQAVEVTFLGVFGNVSTLSAGSVPLQSYYLHRRGLMTGSGIGTMTWEYVLHKSSVLLYATVMLILRGRWLRSASPGLSRYLLLGYLICTLIITALILLCTWEKVQQLARWGIGRLPDTEKWRPRKQLWETNLAALYAQSQRLLRDRKCLGKVIALDAMKLCCLYGIPFFCMKALGVPGPDFWQVQLLTAMMHLISNALPNVAGVGPVEFAFMLIFSHYIEYAQASSVLILYRVSTFFFPFILSIFVFLTVQKRALRHIPAEKELSDEEIQ